jgi:WD40 repeat protein
LSIAAVLQTLEGHSSWINAGTFSPGGKLVASASYNRTVRLLQTLQVHSDSVTAVAVSSGFHGYPSLLPTFQALFREGHE